MFLISYLIFFIYHEVLPIIIGQDMYLRNLCFVRKTSTKIIETNEADDDLCDGSCGLGYGGGVDYLII